MTNATKELDARGLNYPLPIPRTRKTMAQLSDGQVLRIVATDPGSVKDMEAGCRQTGNALLGSEQDGESFVSYGGMAYGAGYVAATQAEVGSIPDPRSAAVPEIDRIYRQYPHIGKVLPAVGYHRVQLQALGETINWADADLVVSATPCDLSQLIRIDKPIVRARYELAEVCEPGLWLLVDRFLERRGLAGGRTCS